MNHPHPNDKQGQRKLRKMQRRAHKGHWPVSGTKHAARWQWLFGGSPSQ